MKRIAAMLVCGVWLLGASLRAQDPPREGVRVNGYGGFGFGATSIQSGQFLTSDYRDLSSELGLDANGFLYDPRFLHYSLSTLWDGNNTAIDQGSARSNGLSFSGGLSFLSQRSFPFTFYFSKSHTNTSGSLIPAFATRTSLWGLRGELKWHKVIPINYNLGLGKTENDLPNGNIFNTHNRFASLNAARRLRGWDLRFGENYLRTASSFSNFLNRNNTLSFDASRAYGERIRMGLGAMYSTFAFSDLGGNNTSSSDVALLNGNLTWKHTEKLDSYYSFNVARNAVNILRTLAIANALPNVTLPLNAQSLNSTSETLAGGSNYRATSNLSFTASLTYSHNGIPQPTVAALTSQTKAVVTTDVLNVDTGYTYRHKIWKLDFHNASSIGWQRFSLLNGAGDSGLGYGLDNGVSGGDVRKARFSASYRYRRRSNPLFFNVVTTSDHRATLKLETEYLRFVTLQGIADLGKTKLNLSGSNINLDTSNYMATASLPQRRLTLFASRGVSSSAERFFSPDSILFEPGGSTGGVELPGALLNPLVYSEVLSQRAGLVWRPRRKLQIESRVSNNRFLFTFLNNMTNRYKQFDTMVEYKFGRFTILVGYGRANGDALNFNQRVNRYFLRVRFPFHVF
jgi:hypothetical protein